MADRIIDLRKKEEISRAGALPTFEEAKEISIEWSAREYEGKKRENGWFIFTGGIALALILGGIFTRSYFFIGLVALAFTVLMMYAKKMPLEMRFAIMSEGVKAGDKMYSYKDLKSFWVFQDLEIPELSLETKATLTPFVRLPLKKVDPERVRSLLRNFLPESEHKEFISDKIARNL